MPRDVLAEIVQRKTREIAEARLHRGLESVRREAEASPAPRGFVEALLDRSRPVAVIAEVKRKSPSAGWIRPEYEGSFSPEGIASRYHAAGAAAISCLTDGASFGGELGYLARVKGAVPIPVLRKDFVLEAYQVYEARAAGADAVLLIAECLEDGRLTDVHAAARGLGLGVLIEAHDRANFDRVVGLFGDPAPAGTLFGVNNRDLRTLQVDLSRTEELVRGLKDPGRVVGESGIRTPADVSRLGAAGVRVLLVGEHLMRQADVGEALRGLLAGT